VSDLARKPPRTWVLWVVRTAIALSVLNFCVGAISSIWMGKRTGSFWWLIEAMPQVSIALLAILICWTPDSRPLYLGINVVVLLMLGMIPSLGLLKWLPLLVGVVALLALVVRPRGKSLMEESPPPAGWPRL
jgi:hypothetical protein